MPFFEGASGTITINDSPMTTVQGNMYHHDHSRRVTNNDSYNTNTRTETNSNNDSSTYERGDNNTYNTFRDGRRVINGLTHVNVRGKTQSSRQAGVPHTPQTRTDAQRGGRAQPQNIEGREFRDYQNPSREQGPQRLLEERQPVQHPWQGAGESMQRQNSRGREELYDYEYPTPARRARESRRPMYNNGGYAPQEDYDMEDDTQPERPPPPSQVPAPERPSLNPFLSYSQPSQRTFEEFTTSAWGNN